MQRQRLIPFTIVGERGHIPGPVLELLDLIPTGGAPLLFRYWGRWPGDCEAVAISIMLDIGAAWRRASPAESGSQLPWQHLIG
jgi:hypothetical protein